MISLLRVATNLTNIAGTGGGPIQDQSEEFDPHVQGQSIEAVSNPARDSTIYTLSKKYVPLSPIQFFPDLLPPTPLPYLN